MADNQLVLRTDDLYIIPIPLIEMDLIFSDHTPENSGEIEKKYISHELCSQIMSACDNEKDEKYIFHTVWRVNLRANIKEQVGLFRFLGPQKKGRVGFELVIYPEYRHMGYARQLIAKMTSFAFDKNDVYYLCSNIPNNEDPVEYERILRRAGFKTEEELNDPFAADRLVSDEDMIHHTVADELFKECKVTSYSAAYVMIGLCIGMIISIYSGLMLEGLAGGLIFSTVMGAIMDHFEIKHRNRILSGEDEKV